MLCGPEKISVVSNLSNYPKTMPDCGNSGTFKIFVGNLVEKTPASLIRLLFEKYGRVVECDVVKNFGFVHMENESEARRAIHNLNGQMLNGQIMKCEPSRPKHSVRPTSKIFVGNLTQNVKSFQVRELFERYGNVIECDIIRNYAFVHMDTNVDVKAAIRELNGYVLDGQPVNIQLSSSRKSGKSEKCFRCGRTGHWSKECSKAAERFRVHIYGSEPYTSVNQNLTYPQERMTDRYEQQDRYGYFDTGYEDYYDNYSMPTQAPIEHVNYSFQHQSHEQILPAAPSAGTDLNHMQTHDLSDGNMYSRHEAYNTGLPVTDYGRGYENYVYPSNQYDRRW